MASITSSKLSSVPDSSILEIPEALQRPSDFGTAAAVSPSASDSQSILPGYEGIIWKRLVGWRVPSDDKKIRTWTVTGGHGWRLEKEQDGTHW